MEKKQRTNVIVDREILSHVCPNCFVRPKAPCIDTRGKVLPIFHAERVKIAQERQLLRLFGDALTNDDKMLILYYAFIMLCDSTSTRARELFDADFDSEQIQAFFCRKAIEELQHDGLLKKPNGESTNTRTISQSRN